VAQAIVFCGLRLPGGQEPGRRRKTIVCPTGRIEELDDRSRTVLIVDDEPQVLRLLEQMLRPRRVNVLIAPRASEALQICEREPIHLLISDVRMPEMDGNKLAERVLKIHPGASVLLISGYCKEAPPLARNSRVRFLKKPFFPSELMKHLEELLPPA
jgi:DNA-binding NtrC family response regulator